MERLVGSIVIYRIVEFSMQGQRQDVQFETYCQKKNLVCEMLHHFINILGNSVTYFSCSSEKKFISIWIIEHINRMPLG